MPAGQLSKRAWASGARGGTQEGRAGGSSHQRGRAARKCYGGVVNDAGGGRGEDSATAGRPKGGAENEGYMRILPSVIETYLRDLRAVLGRDTERARNLLQRLLGDVVLRADQYGLIAEIRGNLNAAVDVDSDGAGRGI